MVCSSSLLIIFYAPMPVYHPYISCMLCGHCIWGLQKVYTKLNWLHCINRGFYGNTVSDFGCYWVEKSKWICMIKPGRIMLERKKLGGDLNIFLVYCFNKDGDNLLLLFIIACNYRCHLGWLCDAQFVR